MKLHEVLGRIATLQSVQITQFVVTTGSVLLDTVKHRVMIIVAKIDHRRLNKLSLLQEQHTQFLNHHHPKQPHHVTAAWVKQHTPRQGVDIGTEIAIKES